VEKENNPDRILMAGLEKKREGAFSIFFRLAAETEEGGRLAAGARARERRGEQVLRLAEGT